MAITSLKGLEHLDINVKIIEQDLERCKELAEGLDNALVLHGDGTDLTLLKAENIEGMDAFLAVTGYDEENSWYPFWPSGWEPKRL